MVDPPTLSMDEMENREPTRSSKRHTVASPRQAPLSPQQPLGCLRLSLDTVRNLDSAMHLDDDSKEQQQPSRSSKSTTSWKSMFTTLQHEHAQEKRKGKHSRTKAKKYKSQLRKAYQDRLTWLEEQLWASTECGTSSRHRPSRSRARTIARTISTVSSSDSLAPDDPPDAQVPPLITSPKEAYEVVYDSQLEDADAYMRNLEQMTQQQEATLQQLQAQLQAQPNPSKYKQQISILKELLGLTEEQLQTERHDYQRERESTLQRVQEMQHLVQTKEEQLATFQSQATQETSRHVAQLAQVQSQVKGLQHEVQAYQTAMADLQQQKRIDANTNVDLEISALLSNDNDLVHRLQHERTEWLAQMETVRTQERAQAAARFQQQDETHQHHLAAVQSQVVQLQEQLHRERQLRSVQPPAPISLPPLPADASDALQQVVHSRNELVQRLRTMEQQHSEAKCAWKWQLEALRTQVKQSEERTAQCETQYQQAQTQHVQALDDLHTQMATARVQATRQWQEHKSVLEKECIQERVQQALEQTECELLLQNEEHLSQLQAAQAELATLRVQHETVTSTLESERLEWQQRHDGQSQDHKTLVQQYHEVRSEAQLLLERSHDLEQRLSTSEEKQTQLQATIHSMDQTLQTAASEKEQHALQTMEWAKQIKDNMQQYQTATAQCLALEEQLQQDKAEQERITREASEWAQQLEASHTNVASLQAQLQEERADRTQTQAQINEWKQKARQSRMEALDLKDRLEILNHRLQEYQQAAKEQETKAQTEAPRLKLMELRKDVSMAKTQAKVELLTDQLAAEVARRERAEKEVSTLNDQADVYMENLMKLQSEKRRLEETLSEAEIKITHALMRRPPELPPVESWTASTSKEWHAHDDQSTPLLEEALALAEGVNTMVQDKGSETDVLEMLESMSVMMENSECLSPHSRKSAPSQSPSTVQVMVEQLYARCQDLESERLSMMEVTLELLESARQASPADMDEALHAAHRLSTEEIQRTRESLHQEREKLFAKICHQPNDQPPRESVGSTREKLLPSIDSDMALSSSSGEVSTVEDDPPEESSERVTPDSEAGSQARAE